MTQHTLMNYKTPQGSYSIKQRKLPKAAVVIDKLLLDRLLYFINRMTSECQWFSLIDRVTDLTSPYETIYYDISDMFIPEQTAAAAEVESDGDQKQKMWQEIMTLRGLDMKALGDLYKRGTFWGHSHVKMAPNPSGTDEKSWTEMVNAAATAYQKGRANQPTGMIILNQQGEYTLRIYDPEIDYEFHNLQLYTETTEDYSYIDAAIEHKVKKAAPVVIPSATTYSTTYSHGSQSYSNKSLTTSWQNESRTIVETEALDHPKAEAPQAGASSGVAEYIHEKHRIEYSKDSATISELATSINLLRKTTKQLYQPAVCKAICEVTDQINKISLKDPEADIKLKYFLNELVALTKTSTLKKKKINDSYVLDLATTVFNMIISTEVNNQKEKSALINRIIECLADDKLKPDSALDYYSSEVTSPPEYLLFMLTIIRVSLLREDGKLTPSIQKTLRSLLNSYINIHQTVG